MMCRCGGWWRHRCSTFGSGRRSLCYGAGDDEIAHPGCRSAEAARRLCGERRAERERAVPRTARRSCQSWRRPRRTMRRRQARASSTACRRAPPSWCASSAPMPTGDDRGSIVARVTAAGLRNDLAEARRELNTLPPADRAPAQAWLDKADARDAALAVSRKFASEAMAALAQARQ